MSQVLVLELLLLFHRERLEHEVRQVKEEVERVEQELVSLRKENRKTLYVSVLIFSLFAGLYYIFTSSNWPLASH